MGEGVCLFQCKDYEALYFPAFPFEIDSGTVKSREIKKLSIHNGISANLSIWIFFQAFSADFDYFWAVLRNLLTIEFTFKFVFSQ